MRTEDDLRAALASLERHAPHPARVLPGEQSAAPRVPRSRKGLRWIAGVSAAAALAGVITALTVPGGITSSHIPNGHVATARATVAPPTLRARLLAAFAAAGGQIIYYRSTTTLPGGGTMVTEKWYLPWQAKPGQQVRSRQLILNADGTPYQDVEDIYLMPAVGYVPGGLPPAVARKLRAHILAGAVATRGEIIDVEYSTRTWSDQKNHVLIDTDPGAPPVVAYDVAAEHWTVAGTTELDGHRAIELTWRASGGSSSYLWVDASTYMPLREESAFPAGGPGQQITTTRDDYELLPATAANLALLAPAIPAGFRHTAQQVLPANGKGVG